MILFWILLLLLGVLMSSFYAGFETGVYSLNPVRIAHRAEEGFWSAQILQSMRKKLDEFIVTILIGNNLAVHIASSASTHLFAAILGMAFFQSLSSTVREVLTPSLLASLFLTPIAFLFSEIVPKRLFSRYAARMVYHPVPILTYLLSYYLYYLPTQIIRKFLQWLTALMGTAGEQSQAAFSRRQMLDILERNVSGLSDLLEDMAVNLTENSRSPVAERMIPLADCFLIPVDRSVEQFIETAVTSRRSRIPVYDKEASHPIGVVDLFSALRAAEDSGRSPSLRNLVRPLTTFSEEMPSLDALQVMQKMRISLAGVVNKKGEVVGLLPVSRLAERIALPLERKASRMIAPSGSQLQETQRLHPVSETRSPTSEPE